MKNIIITMAFMLISMVVIGQSHAKVEINGNKVIEIAESKSTVFETGYVYIDKNNVEYPIYVTSNGRCFIYKTSKKSGNDYRKYLDADTSKEICRKLGIEYKETKK